MKLCANGTQEIFATSQSENSNFVRVGHGYIDRDRTVLPIPITPQAPTPQPARQQSEVVKLRFGRVHVQIKNAPDVLVREENGDLIIHLPKSGKV
ncbi:MAG: hypothetical protein FWE38_02485 [Firmicutes bacterium]|nr:hypothetical protein [Bacillota bacterium]